MLIKVRCYISLLLTFDSQAYGLVILCFYSKTRFWPSYCQISTDLDKILHTPVIMWNTLVGRLDRNRQLQAKPERLCFFFYNTCNAP